MQGTIKFYNAHQGFGFVTHDDGQDIYFSNTSLPRDRRFDPVEGDRVTFEVRDARKGKIAHHIELEA